MTSIVTWNIQYGKGCDGRTDLARIARVVRAMGEADVICMQEIPRNDPDFGDSADMAAQLAKLFPEYDAFYGPALSRKGVRGRRDFGNLLLSSLPVLQVFNHLLPRPPEGGMKHMQRQAIEAVVETSAGPLRVMTTHLEYYSVRQRAAQVERLRALQEETAGNAATPPVSNASPYDEAARPASLVLCGDLNLLPQDPEYAQLFREPLVDAWKAAHPGKPHPLSTGLYDKEQWGKTGPHCRDYFAVTPDVAKRVVSVEMDDRTDASDHQPLRLVIKDQ